MEKETVKQSELESWVKDTTKKTVEEQIQSLIDEQVNPYLKAQLAEQLPDALAGIVTPADPEEEKAKEKANEFKDGAEFLKALVDFKRGKEADPRLVLMSKQGTPVTKVAGHLEIGEDSQGGYGTNAHPKPDYMLENPKALNTTHVTISRI